MTVREYPVFRLKDGVHPRRTSPVFRVKSEPCNWSGFGHEFEHVLGYEGPMIVMIDAVI